MSDNNLISSEEIKLRPSQDARLINLDSGGSSALSEIITSSLSVICEQKALQMKAPQPGEEREFIITPEIRIIMCWIPAGDFMMGSPDDEPARFECEAQHRVIITKGFWLAKYPITQLQWQAVMGSNPSKCVGNDWPVDSISWNDVAGSEGFVERLNRYVLEGGRFSLPTEAQWEYACRSGTTTSLNSGKNLTVTSGFCPNLAEVAYYRITTETQRIGMRRPNTWGIHDMHGNVWEWCEDWMLPFTSEPAVDPRGPDTGSHRVLRGGCRSSHAANCRSARRTFQNPSVGSCLIGFRVVRSANCKPVSGAVISSEWQGMGYLSHDIKSVEEQIFLWKTND